MIEREKSLKMELISFTEWIGTGKETAKIVSVQDGKERSKELRRTCRSELGGVMRVTAQIQSWNFRHVSFDFYYR